MGKGGALVFSPDDRKCEKSSPFSAFLRRDPPERRHRLLYKEAPGVAQAVPWRPGDRFACLCVSCGHSRLVRSGPLCSPGGLWPGEGRGGGRPSGALPAERRWRRLVSRGAGAEVSEGEGCSKMAAASDP